MLTAVIIVYTLGLIAYWAQEYGRHRLPEVRLKEPFSLTMIRLWYLSTSFCLAFFWPIRLWSSVVGKEVSSSDPGHSSR